MSSLLLAVPFGYVIRWASQSTLFFFSVPLFLSVSKSDDTDDTVTTSLSPVALSSKNECLSDWQRKKEPTDETFNIENSDNVRAFKKKRCEWYCSGTAPVQFTYARCNGVIEAKTVLTLVLLFFNIQYFHS